MNVNEQRQYFQELIEKYLAGTATAEEQAFIHQYHDWHEHQPDVIAGMPAKELLRLKAQLKGGILRELMLKTPATIHPLRWLSVAAAVIVMLMGSKFLYNKVFNTGPVIPDVSQWSVMAAGDKVKHTWLSDGTIVYLNKGSIIRQSPAFDQQKREVYIEGEVYFDVAPDANQPFTVYTQTLITRVLGTAFNVRTNGKGQTITVTKGRVEVSSKAEKQQLAANQQLEYEDGKVVVQHNIDAAGRLGWKPADYQFDNVNIGDITALLERRFKVKVIFASNALRTQKITAAIGDEDSLIDVMQIISLVSHLKYSIQQNTVNISR
jgi:ferric-dicitrate binding protein FerR (iron transport regulator)